MISKFLGKALWRTASIVLVLAVTSCSILGPDEDKIKVVNGTGVTVFFLAMELQASHLFDPAPTVVVEPSDSRVLPPGASRSLPMKDIAGPFQLGDDLRFFLYEVVGDTAVSRPIVTLTARELRDSDYRVTFSGF